MTNVTRTDDVRRHRETEQAVLTDATSVLGGAA